jgi:hypothetical protein
MLSDEDEPLIMRHIYLWTQEGVELDMEEEMQTILVF